MGGGWGKQKKIMQGRVTEKQSCKEELKKKIPLK